MSFLFNPSEAFLTGENGVFETFPFVSERLVFFADHWERMKASCASLGFPFPFQINEVKRGILKQLSLLAAEGVLPKPSMTEGNLGFGNIPDRPQLDDETHSKIIRLTYRMDRGNPELSFQILPPRPFKESWRLLVVRVVPHPMAAHKITSREAYETSRGVAVEAGADDALLVDLSGEALETTRANFFMMMNETILTPPTDGKILPGIVRGRLLKIAGTVGIPIKEHPFTLDEVKSADELWVSNSVIGVLPVKEVLGIWKQKAPGKFSRELRDAYEKALA